LLSSRPSSRPSLYLGAPDPSSRPSLLQSLVSHVLLEMEQVHHLVVEEEQDHRHRQEVEVEYSLLAEAELGYYAGFYVTGMQIWAYLLQEQVQASSQQVVSS